MKIISNGNHIRCDLWRLGLPKTVYYPLIRVNFKMNRLLLITSLMFVPYFVHSQQPVNKRDLFRENIIRRDSSGRNQKIYGKNFFGDTLMEGESERSVVTYKKDVFGNDVEEDDKGRKRIYKKNIFGDTIVEDERGKVIATYKKDIFGNYIEEDDKGRKRVYKKNIFGDTIVEDERGKVIQTIKKDIFGNTVVETN